MQKFLARKFVHRSCPLWLCFHFHSRAVTQFLCLTRKSNRGKNNASQWWRCWGPVPFFTHTSTLSFNL